MRVDEFAPALAAIAKGAQAVGGAVAKGAQAVGGALANTAQTVRTAVANNAAGTVTGTPATPTGSAAQAQTQQAAPQQQTLGAMDIVNALKDPQVALQLKAMKQKMPGGNLDAMVDPKGAADQQKQIGDLSKALDTLKKNAGIK